MGIKISGTVFDHRCKFSEQQKADIKTARESGLSYGIIAHRFGCSRTTVRMICDEEFRLSVNERLKAYQRAGRYNDREKNKAKQRKYYQHLKQLKQNENGH